MLEVFSTGRTAIQMLVHTHVGHQKGTNTHLMYTKTYKWRTYGDT